jgi:hypothetical protein
VNVVPDDPWTGSREAPPCASLASQLPNLLRGGLRDAYVGVLSESIPEGLARCLARLNPESQPIAGESASAPRA